MFMNKTTRLLALLTLAAGLQAATLTLDDFTVAQGAGDPAVTLPSGVVRTLMVIPWASSLPPVKQTLSVSGGYLDLTNGAGDTGVFVLMYDLSALLFPSIYDPNGTVTLRLVENDANAFNLAAGGLASGSYDVAPLTASASYVFPFTPSEGSLVFVIQGDGGLDAMFEGGVTAELNEVPEPGSLALMGVGLIGAAYVKRRKAVRES